jgi:hypothetical protein
MDIKITGTEIQTDSNVIKVIKFVDVSIEKDQIAVVVNNMRKVFIGKDDNLYINGALATGTLADKVKSFPDDFFVEAPSEGGGGEWFGTQQEYDALDYHNPNTKYYIESEAVRLDAPENLTATEDGFDTINLEWDLVDDAEKYVLERSETGDFTDTVQIYEGAELEYSDTGLTAETQYYYRLRAIAHGANPSNYATANATTSEGLSVEAISWSQLQNAVDSGSGTITGTSTIPIGGTATKKLSKANGNYVEYINNSSDGAVLCLEAVDNANYRWNIITGNIILSSVYVYMGNAHALTGQANGGGDAVIDSASVNDVYRLEISGDDVLVKKSTDNGNSYSTLLTHSGVLTGVTNIYVVAIIAAGGSKRLNNVKGFGLINI